MVNGVWWAVAAVQPVILSLGAVLSAIDIDLLSIQPIEFKKWFLSEEAEEENEEEEGVRA